jgi:hypothetical protein
LVAQISTVSCVAVGTRQIRGQIEDGIGDVIDMRELGLLRYS